MFKYDVVIGIEVHIELKTKTKMFSRGEVTYAKKPNSKVNENDLALPGTIPIVNKKGVELAIQACKCLNMEIDSILKFDRKNYCYSDLPKGFQITQQFFPIGKNGYLEIELEDNKTKKISINRLHIEEDTAKQIHKDNKTYLDYNRAGVGLIEIVTNPVMTNEIEATQYIKKLQEIISFSNISKAKMNEGSMRCDINISLKSKNNEILGSKVEIKNLNSINNIKNAIIYEINRQSKILDKNEKVLIETRRFDEDKKITISMRKKDTQDDYHFFPEPNINAIKLSKEFIENAISKIPEFSDEIRKKLRDIYFLNNSQINILLKNKELLNFFYQITTINKNYLLIINNLTSDVLSYLNKNNKKISDTKLTINNFNELILLLEDKKISSSQSKKILFKILEENISPRKIIKKSNIIQIDDDLKITKILIKIIDNNNDMLKQYNNRPERVLKFYIGLAMKETKGKINPVKTQKILKELIIKKVK